ncbi:DUF2314 domain-containing protein [Bremerella sp. JC817]|uniref:DUF2314 domain-containing protein n=1 Tax=Bremerella sp. JC817 TaxID=3231756 RepID=UPI00345955B8
MNKTEEPLIPVFIPSLGAVLLSAENKKGEPLTPDEVINIRDNAACIMMEASRAKAMAEKRGEDLDPENCWFDFQMLRRELDRKPDLDPGPKFRQINSNDDAYKQTVIDAQKSLDTFRAMLPADGSHRMDAMIKFRFTDGDFSAFMWLFSTRLDERGFAAVFFEVPEQVTSVEVGDEAVVTPDEVIDWMVNDDGNLHGGFSIRYQRERMPEAERAAYDEYIGVQRYL